MRYLLNENTDPYFNLAAEEYLLKHTDDEVFTLWRNDNAIIVGKNQNTLSEINTDFVKEKGIRVVRRQTGGGAVFHDLGNLNYTFIVNDSKSFNDFKGFATPIINALKEMGVDAEFSGRNDMLISGMKFSGNAQCKYRNRVMHHGTLLFSSLKSDISGALKPREVKFSDKAIKSVASRITNISEHMVQPMTVLEFRDRIFKYLMTNMDSVIETYSEEDIKSIEKLRDQRYSTWEWNFGMSPKYAQTKEKKFTGGVVEVTLEARNGIIEKLRIYGDFFGTKEVAALETCLIGIRHDADEVGKVLSSLNLGDFMVNVTPEELLGLIV